MKRNFRENFGSFSARITIGPASEGYRRSYIVSARRRLTIVAETTGPNRLFDGASRGLFGGLRRRHRREELQGFNQVAVGVTDAFQHRFFDCDGDGDSRPAFGRGEIVV